MKKLILLFSLFVGLNVFAQEEDYLTDINIDNTRETMLKTFVEDYFAVVKTLDLDKMLDITHPGLYTVAPRDLIKEQLEAAFINDFFKMEFTQIAYDSVEDAYMFKGSDYYITIYKSILTMTFEQSAEQTDEDFESYMEYLMELYTIQFKDDTLTREGNVIKISGLKRLLIVDSPEFEGMKMLEIKPGLNEVYKQFIPAIVVDALGNG